jgi:hypothetical protein
MRALFAFAALAVSLFVGAESQAALLSSSLKATSSTADWKVNASTAYAVSYGAEPWVQSVWTNPLGGWINGNASGNPIANFGTYTYTQEFTVNPAQVPGGANIVFTTAPSFQLAADNDFRVFMNGTLIQSGSQAFGALTTISGFSILNNVKNILSIEVVNRQPDNGFSPTGLLVTNVQGEYDTQFVAPIPEPMSVALWGGLGGLGLVCRFRKKARKS